jgi:hypothetical protein
LQVLAVAGSNQYLVYTKFRLDSTTGDRLPTGGVFVRTRSGKTRRLGSVSAHSVGSFSLAGSTLLEAGDHGQHVWNVATGAEYSATYGVIAAPGGYLRIVEAGQYRLEEHTTSGTTVAFKSPFPRRPFALKAGPSSYVAFTIHSDARVGVAVGRYASPRKVTFLVRHGPDDSVYCGVPGPTAVACLVSNETEALRVYSSSGSLLDRTGRGCLKVSNPPATLRRGAVWTGCGHHLYELNASGTVSHSAVRYRARTPVEAYGRSVVSNLSETALLSVRSADTKPSPVVRVT